MPSKNEEDSFYTKRGVTPPSRQPHTTIEEIVANMKPLKPTNWRQAGNLLIADTAMGELVNYLPTDYLLDGTDDKGLPILRKI